MHTSPRMAAHFLYIAFFRELDSTMRPSTIRRPLDCRNGPTLSTSGAWLHNQNFFEPIFLLRMFSGRHEVFLETRNVSKVSLGGGANVRRMGHPQGSGQWP